MMRPSASELGELEGRKVDPELTDANVWYRATLSGDSWSSLPKRMVNDG
jgi:hypothetical protein